MRVRLIADQLGPNPDFDRRRPAGDDNPVNRIVPAGTEIENREALFLVINDQAEPIDQEAQTAYARYLEKREAALQTKQQRSGLRAALPLQATAPVPQPTPTPAAVTPMATPTPANPSAPAAAAEDKPEAGQNTTAGPATAPEPASTPALQSPTPQPSVLQPGALASNLKGPAQPD